MGGAATRRYLAGQLNEVELEGKTLRATLEDLQSRHRQVLKKLDIQSRDESVQQALLTNCKAQLVRTEEELHTLQQSHAAKEGELLSKQEQLKALSEELSRADKLVKDTEVKPIIYTNWTPGRVASAFSAFHWSELASLGPLETDTALRGWD